MGDTMADAFLEVYIDHGGARERLTVKDRQVTYLPMPLYSWSDTPREFTPSDDVLAEVWQRLDELRVWEWKQRYTYWATCVGEWIIRIEHGGRMVKAHGQHYPPTDTRQVTREWSSFLDTLSLLTPGVSFGRGSRGDG